MPAHAVCLWCATQGAGWGRQQCFPLSCSLRCFQSSDDLELPSGWGKEGGGHDHLVLAWSKKTLDTLRQSNQSYLRVHSGLAIFALNPGCLKFEILGYPWTAGCQP